MPTSPSSRASVSLSNNRDLKTVVITGGGSGIGFQTAQTLLATGLYHVAIVGKLGEAGEMEQARKALLKFLPKAPTPASDSDARKSSDFLSAYECDLADSKALRSTAERILAVHKSIYGLVNNAGVYPFGGVEGTTEAEWDQTMNVNLKATFLMTQALVPALKRSSGGARIVNVSSTAGLLPNSFALAYSVSKAAMIQFSKTIAKELGKEKITVNCVCPGIVRSPMHEAYHRNDAELQSFYAKRGAAFPLGRIGEASDVASAIEFLLSEKATWITGDVLVVDGGRLLL